MSPFPSLIIIFVLYLAVSLGSPEQPFLQALALNISLSAISAMHGII